MHEHEDILGEERELMTCGIGNSERHGLGCIIVHTGRLLERHRSSHPRFIHDTVLSRFSRGWGMETEPHGVKYWYETVFMKNTTYPFSLMIQLPLMLIEELSRCIADTAPVDYRSGEPVAAICNPGMSLNSAYIMVRLD